MNEIMSYEENYAIPFEELLKKYQEFWKKFTNIPKYSPFSLMEETTNIGKNLQELLLVSSKMQYFTVNYISQITKTYAEALDKLPSNNIKYEIKSEQDLKKYRNILIGTLEESFTNLFQSKEFGMLVSDMMSTYSDYNKLLKNISNTFLVSLNLSNKDDIDVILKEMQELKRQVRDLRKTMDIIISEDKKIAK
jgi:Poly(R)-hydroxyalkanoic acid synthase subunit (PHA_synth_III_E)